MTPRNVNGSLPPRVLGTLDEIREIKAAEKAALRQAERQAIRAMTANTVWLCVGAVLGFTVLLLA